MHFEGFIIFQHCLVGTIVDQTNSHTKMTLGKTDTQLANQDEEISAQIDFLKSIMAFHLLKLLFRE